MTYRCRNDGVYAIHFAVWKGFTRLIVHTPYEILTAQSLRIPFHMTRLSSIDSSFIVTCINSNITRSDSVLFAVVTVRSTSLVVTLLVQNYVHHFVTRVDSSHCLHRLSSTGDGFPQLTLLQAIFHLKLTDPVYGADV